MRSFTINLFLFIALSLIFSSFSGCNGTANSQKGPVDETKSNTTTAEKKDDGYPPLPSAIAQAEIKALDGSTFKLEDKKGKVVLVNLWATWCGPCIAEMPHLNEMQEKYRDQGFEIVGLNTDDESLEDIKTFAADKKLNYQLGWSDNKLTAEFIKITKLSGIPQSVLINRDGKMTGIFTGGGPNVIASMKQTVEKNMAQ